MLRLPFDFFTRRASVVRNLDDVSALGLPVLASISKFDPRPGARLPGEDHPEALEAYRRLIDAVRAPEFHLRGRAIVVTSAEPGAGKSTTAKNLATLLARGGSKVILVDADLRRVARRRPGDGTSSSGFAGLLVNQLRVPSNSLVHTMDPRLKLLPAGSVTGTPDELLRSTRLPLVVDALREMADHVVIDVEPATRELLRLTRIADVTLIVVHAGGSSKRASHAVSTLREANAGLLGIVLNRAPVLVTAPRIEGSLPVVGAAVPVPEAPEDAAAEAPHERLVIAVDELLADLEASLRLIRDIRQVSEVADEAEEPEEEDAELVTMDR